MRNEIDACDNQIPTSKQALGRVFPLLLVLQCFISSFQHFGGGCYCFIMMILAVVLLFIICLNASRSVDGIEQAQQVYSSHTNGAAKHVLTYLQQEQVACTAAQQSIIQNLRNRKIPIGGDPGTLRKPVHGLSNTIHDRLTTSSEANPIECRVTLNRVSDGTKCVAPCGCTGSQKWMEFSAFNKLRRKDPQQWITCQTCKQPFQYDLFTSYGGTSAALIGFILDYRSLFRGLSVAVVAIAMYMIGVQNWITSLLVSEGFWQMYPRWAKLVHLPLALKIWLLRLGSQYLSEHYVALEKRTVIEYLADLETRIIEQNLPDEENEVNTSDAEEDRSDTDTKDDWNNKTR